MTYNVEMFSTYEQYVECFNNIKAFIFKDEISMRRTKHILKMELLDGFELVDNCNFVVDPKYFVQAV